MAERARAACQSHKFANHDEPKTWKGRKVNKMGQVNMNNSLFSCSPKDDQQRLLQDCMNSQIIGQDTNKRKIVGTDHRRITRSAARKQSTESPGPAASTSKMLENVNK